MTPETFCTWLADMKSAGLARSDADCGRLLGRKPDSIVNYKTKGTKDRSVELACAALLAGLPPYGAAPDTDV